MRRYLHFLGLTASLASADVPPYSFQLISPSRPLSYLTSVANLGGTWVVLGGSDGIAMRSRNGADWESLQTGMTGDPQQLISGDTWLLEFGDRNRAVYVTHDSRTWVSHDIGILPIYAAWNGKMMVVAGDYGGYATSVDGNTWNQGQLNTTKTLRCAAWTGDNWIMLTDDGLIFISKDGKDWTPGFSDQFNQNAQTVPWLIWNGNMLVGPYSNTIVTSADGTRWSKDAQHNLYYVGRPVWAGTHWVATRSGKPIRSSDGIIWEEIPGLTAQVNALAWNLGLLVAVGRDGEIYTTYDESHWTTFKPGTFNISPWSVAASDSTLVAVGNGGVVSVSHDGRSWSSIQTSLPTDLLKVIRSPLEFLAMDNFGDLLSSQDGMTWTDVTPSNRLQLHDVMWAGDRYFAATDSGVRFSRDGRVWEERKVSPFPYTMHAVAWNGSRYFVAGQQYFTSTDGIVWDRVESSLNLFPAMTGMGCHDSICVAMGRGGFNFVTLQSGRYTVVESHGTPCRSAEWMGDRFFGVCFDDVRSVEKVGDWVTYPLGGMAAATRFHDSLFVVGGSRREVWAAPLPPASIGIIRRTPHSGGVRQGPGFVRFDLDFNRVPGARVFAATLDGRMIQAAPRWITESALEVPTNALANGVYRLEVASGSKRTARVFCVAH